MKKFYYLKTCDTCRRIMKELSLGADVELREIKSQALIEGEIDQLAEKAGSYGIIFNKRAQKLKQRGLKANELSELEMRDLLLEDYTFLARPIFETGGNLVAGNSRESVETMKTMR